MFKILDGREHFFQWDLNQKLIVEDATVVEVHFCNKTDDCSLVCEVYEEAGLRVANVPNIILQDSWDIRVYAFTGEATKVEQRFKVIARTRPADYVYEETHVKTWDALAEQIGETVTRCEEGEDMRVDAELAREEAETAREEAFDEAISDFYNDKNEAFNNFTSTSVLALNSAYQAAERANKAADRAEANIVNFANALKGNKSGAAVKLSDVSPIEHPMKVSVSAKNLMAKAPVRKLKCDFADCYFVPKGKYTVSMNFTEATSWRFTITAYDVNGKLITDTTTNTAHVIGISQPLNYSSGNGGIYQNAQNITSNYMSFETDNDYYIGINFHFGNTSATTTVTNAQLEKGIAATAYVPYVEDVSGAVIYQYGKNLIPYPYYSANGVTTNGITYTINSDGTVTANGTATANSDFYLFLDRYNLFPVNGKQITLSGCPSGGSTSTYYVAISGANTYVDIGSGRSQLMPHDCHAIYLRIQKGTTVNNLVFKPQIEIGTTATEYEQYIAPITADGTIEAITSIYPTTTFTSDTPGVLFDVEYNRDINKAFAELQQALISMGGNV